MQQLDLTLGLVMVVSSLGTAFLALLLMSYLQPARRIAWTPIDEMGERVVFLFRDRALVDATPDARALLQTGPDFLSDWPRLLAVLDQRFSGFAGEIGQLAERQYFLLRNDVGETMEAEWRGGLARIVVTEAEGAEAQTPAVDHFAQTALSEELATLRSVLDGAPILVWKEDAEGAVRWANGAYVALAERLMAEDSAIGWPLPRIFEQRPVGPDMATPPRRLSVRDPATESERLWFETYDEAQGEDTLVFALPADKLVRAEDSLREFVQTLTKTFAHLPTGLAVFDSDRRLALFNPALTDLSALEPHFLSDRPTLFEFLDRLRQKQRAPEPKDFKSWRREIVELESAAASGTYQETWSLPDGQTFRVTGRPHPGGAIAFLFEDISSEVSLTRRFRAELELGRAVLDNIDEAIAVFTGSGRLVYSNSAYARLWNHDPDATLGDTGIVEATQLWQKACAPTPTWGDLRDFVSAPIERTEWTAQVRRKDGVLLNCRFVPLVGHATLAAFLPVAETREAHDAPPKVWTRMPAALR
ncbi:PAS-domain containing protein [Tropicimonas sp. IMCC6043]|uniref:PAS-domain containing protein n=1 Tax=Tropicimonas sp. IMCC6043 TaxID=2510645 RepID=UPI00101BA78C|nr:PAS-domain containing protein [Tropicimonas sp. IMCC6043]RYH10895.1 PAS domain-containing protein [Tropicimonas sp. IMCC6043]